MTKHDIFRDGILRKNIVYCSDFYFAKKKKQIINRSERS